MSYCRSDITSYPFNLSLPFNSVNSIAKSKATTSPPAASTSLVTASIVPPVANKSSTIATLCPF